MGFFNDVGGWINDKVLNPIGTWAKDTWNGAVDRMKRGETIFDQVNKKIVENENTINAIKGYEKAIDPIVEPIKNKVSNAIIDYNPLATAEEKQQAKEELKYLNDPFQETLDKIKENQETSGNSQSIENTQDTPTVQELWEREDAIRKETQEREDTAYQRAVEDMRKAGINPNLVGISPAGSGGGITQATGQQVLTTEMSNIIEEAVNEINNTVKKGENTKDRITEIIETVIRAYVIYKTAGIIKK